MNICLLTIVGILCAIGVSECIECFNCLNVTEPRTCPNTTQCSNSESCYLQTLHSGTEVRYDMGCQNNQFCSSKAVSPNGIIGRSTQTRQQYSCHECCSSSNRCNEHLCAQRKPSSCIDDETLDCAHLNSIYPICADVQHAKTTCPKFCDLCNLVDGNWGNWGEWATCSLSCSNGTKTRTRTCSNPSPSNNGLNCTGPSVESKLCSIQLCPVHGNWSDWSLWSNCSVACNVGVRKKTRTCTNPKPDRSGNECVGESIEYTVCLNEPCSVIDGGWSTWGAWQSCSVSCGVGRKLMSRTCTSPSPTLYGKACEGNSDAFDVCVNTPCHAVAFNAYGVNILSNNVNAFSTVIFNEGNAYNPSTGHFTAPVGGIYHFSAQMCVSANTGIVFYVQKGSATMSGAVYLTSTLNDNYNVPTCTSASCSVKLTMNEHVWIMMEAQYTSHMYTSYWNSFTGMLVQEL